MGKLYTSIPDFLVPWIQQQKIFWVATAPLSQQGHVNVSPKGFDNTFRIESDSRVWYEDLTGSGNETISHVRENGRITIMFVAFEGPPRIVRLFGTGTVYEFGTSEYESLLPINKRQPGSRAAIIINIHKVGSSCGYSIPFFTFSANRMKLHSSMSKREGVDLVEHEQPTPRDPGTLNEKGLKYYWKETNSTSMDGLPGLLYAPASQTPFGHATAGRLFAADNETIVAGSPHHSGFNTFVDIRTLFGFIFGVIFVLSAQRLF